MFISPYFTITHTCTTGTYANEPRSQHWSRLFLAPCRSLGWNFIQICTLDYKVIDSKCRLTKAAHEKSFFLKHTCLYLNTCIIKVITCFNEYTRLLKCTLSLGDSEITFSPACEIWDLFKLAGVEAVLQKVASAVCVFTLPSVIYRIQWDLIYRTWNIASRDLCLKRARWIMWQVFRWCRDCY
jgi:hypothetical protein